MSVHLQVGEVVEDLIVRVGLARGLEELGVLLDEEGGRLASAVDGMLEELQQEGDVRADALNSDSARRSLSIVAS